MRALAFVSDRMLVAGGGGRRLIRLSTDAAGAAPVSFGDPATDVTALASDGNAVVWGEAAGLGLTLATVEGQALSRYEVISPQGVTAIAIVSSNARDDYTIAVGAEAEVKLVRASSGSIHQVGDGLAKGDSNAVGLAALPRGRLALGFGGDHALRVYDLRTGEDLRPRSGGHADAITSVALSRQESLVLTGSPDGSAIAWDATSSEPARWCRVLSDPGTASIVEAVTFAGPSDRVVVARFDGSVETLDPRVEVLPRRGGNAVSRAVVGRPDTPVVLVGGEDSKVHVLDLSSGRAREVPFPGWVFAIAWPRVDRAYALTDGAGLWRFDPAMGERALVLNKSRASAFAISGAEAPSVLVGDMDGRLLFQQASGTAPIVLGAHENVVTAVAFVPVTRLALSASRDRTLCVWDVETRSLRERVDLGPVHDHVTSLALTKDGRRAYAGTGRGVVLALDLHGGS